MPEGEVGDAEETGEVGKGGEEEAGGVEVPPGGRLREIKQRQAFPPTPITPHEPPSTSHDLRLLQCPARHSGDRGSRGRNACPDLSLINPALNLEPPALTGLIHRPHRRPSRPRPTSLNLA